MLELQELATMVHEATWQLSRATTTKEIAQARATLRQRHEALSVAVAAELPDDTAGDPLVLSDDERNALTDEERAALAKHGGSEFVGIDNEADARKIYAARAAAKGE